jgi:hypothetical protein
MEHTVSGVSDMHVSEMRLTVGLCQPGEKCNKCATHGIYDILVIGLNVSYSHTLYMFCSDRRTKLTFML